MTCPVVVKVCWRGGVCCHRCCTSRPSKLVADQNRTIAATAAPIQSVASKLQHRPSINLSLNVTNPHTNPLSTLVLQMGQLVAVHGHVPGRQFWPDNSRAASVLAALERVDTDLAGRLFLISPDGKQCKEVSVWPSLNERATEEHLLFCQLNGWRLVRPGEEELDLMDIAREALRLLYHFKVGGLLAGWRGGCVASGWVLRVCG